MSYLMSPCSSTIRFFISSVSGPIELPSPKISSVTPWRMSPCERPSAISDSIAQDSMLMKPGTTARPVGIDHGGGTGGSEVADRGDAVAVDGDVGRAAGAPVPSKTVPPRIRTSKAGAGGAAGPPQLTVASRLKSRSVRRRRIR